LHQKLTTFREGQREEASATGLLPLLEPVLRPPNIAQVVWLLFESFVTEICYFSIHELPRNRNLRQVQHRLSGHINLLLNGGCPSRLCKD